MAGRLCDALVRMTSQDSKLGARLIPIREALAGPLTAARLSAIDARLDALIEELAPAGGHAPASAELVSPSLLAVPLQAVALTAAGLTPLLIEDAQRQAVPRRGLLESCGLDRLPALCQRTPLAVVLLDLDDRSALRDTLGQAAAERALAHLATTARAGLRSGELIARTGDGQFVLVFPATPVQTAVEIVRRLQRETGCKEFIHDGQMRCLSFSGGATAWVEGESLPQTLQRAAAALAAAKRAGSKRLVIG